MSQVLYSLAELGQLGGRFFFFLLNGRHEYTYTYVIIIMHIPAIFSAVYSATMRIRSISTTDSNTRQPAPTTTRSHCSRSSSCPRIPSSRALGTPEIYIVRNKNENSKTIIIPYIIIYISITIVSQYESTNK